MQSGDTAPSLQIDFTSAEGRLQRAGERESQELWCECLMWHNKKLGPGWWEPRENEKMPIFVTFWWRWVELRDEWGAWAGTGDWDVAIMMTRRTSWHQEDSVTVCHPRPEATNAASFLVFPLLIAQNCLQLCVGVRNVMNFVVIQTNWNNGSAGTNLTMQIGKGRVTEYFEMFN